MSDTWWISARDLKPEQEAVVRIQGHGDFLVTGPPGSGKTNALMLRAEYLNKMNRKNYQIIVFTRALKEFLAACPNPSVPPDKLKTLSGWLMETINTFNGQVSQSSDFDVSRMENVATLLALLDERDSGVLVDTLLLDEAQDFTEQEVGLFRRVAREIYAVGDSRQRIYEERGGLAAIRSFCQELTLHNHFRNGQAICKVADQIGGRWDGYAPMLPTAMYKEAEMPSSCESAKYDDLDAQIDAIKKAIPLQLEAYPNGIIGVMSPKREVVSRIAAAFEQAEFWHNTVVQSDDGTLHFAPDTRVCVCTVHSGKGLEFRVVHIAAAEDFKRFRDGQWRMAYTAITRAKTRLLVYYSGAIPAFFEAALAASEEEGAIENPSLDDLFQ